MNGDGQNQPAPALILIGGFAGSGKTALSRRLSAEFRIPRLGSDTLGRTIRNSAGIHSSDVDAYWIAYDLLFCLCEEFVEARVSVILDLTMGWAFQWQQTDGIVERNPGTLFLPIMLSCPYERCLERTRQRYEADPAYYDAPEVCATEPKNRQIWEFLARLDRPDLHWVDADRPHEDVYAQVRAYIVDRLEE